MEAELYRLRMALLQAAEALQYAANRLDADSTQVQVAGDCAIAAAVARVQANAIPKARK